jgi:hypothetical protein
MHFIEKIPPTGKKAKPQRRYAVFSLQKIRRVDLLVSELQSGLVHGFLFQVQLKHTQTAEALIQCYNNHNFLLHTFFGWSGT